MPSETSGAANHISSSLMVDFSITTTAPELNSRIPGRVCACTRAQRSVRVHPCVPSHWLGCRIKAGERRRKRVEIMQKTTALKVELPRVCV